MTNEEELEFVIQLVKDSFHPNTKVSESAFEELVRLARYGKETEDLAKKGKAMIDFRYLQKHKPKVRVELDNEEDFDGLNDS